MEWRIRLSFLVSAPRRNPHQQLHHLLPMPAGSKDHDNRLWVAAESLSPFVLEKKKDGPGEEWVELGTETVECEIPIMVLPGHATVARPISHAL